ncbi:MAG: amidohydrolase family protein [Acidimicrobiales bacterium]
MGNPDYLLFDADNHYYEPPDAFTRFIEPMDRDKAVRVVAGDDGRNRIVVGDRPFTFLENWSFETHARPGSLRELLRNMSSGALFESGGVEQTMDPAWINRAARLALMDEQGIESCFVLPTLAVCVEHFMKDDVAKTYANLRSFNRWLDDEWGFNHQNRIYAPPLMSLLDLERGVAELEWAIARGARIVHLRPGPAFGRSPADPYFNPFWARLDEAGVAVAFHISESGYNELYSTAWGEPANPSSHRQSALQWTSFYGDRPIMDTIAALVYHNLFGRFPNVRVVSIENGSLWVPYLMKAMDKMNRMGRNGPWPGGKLEGKPSDIVKRHVFVSPYHEEDIVSLVELIGASQVLFGSDFPHPEGLSEPRDFAKALEGLTDYEIRMIMRDNGMGLVGAGVRA